MFNLDFVSRGQAEEERDGEAELDSGSSRDVHDDGQIDHRPGRYHVIFLRHLRGNRQGKQPRRVSESILFSSKSTNTIQEYTLTLPHVRNSDPLSLTH